MALLEGLFASDNEEVWREFDARYRPIIVGFARTLGLSTEDAADVAQETLLRFIRDYGAGKYDRRRGRLRSWIIGIVKHRVADLKRAKAASRERRGESAFVEIPDEEQLAAMWDRERHQTLLRQAISELRETTKLTDKTIRAFERYVLHEQAAGEVACELGISTHDVYMAKNRVAERLRGIVARLDELFDDG
jgi:RNA polymerase sigma-70 factor (ECF subfamily)